jgi:hypothetical protein
VVAFGELRRCDPEYWHALATRLRGLAVAVERRSDSVSGVGGRLGAAWDEGPAGRAAVSKVKGHAVRLGASNDVLLAVANLLDGHAAAMAGYRSRLNAAIARGESSVCMPGGHRMVFIHDDGRVTLTVPTDLYSRPTVSELTMALLRHARDEIEHEIRETLRLATDADESAARRISAHLPAVALAAHSPEAAKVPESAVPARGAPPGDVRRWWDSLTPQQQHVIEHYPQRVGWLDGVPAYARDQANRIVFDGQHADLLRQQAALQAALAATPRTQPLAAQRLAAQLLDVNNKLDGMDVVSARLASTEPCPAYLLGWDITKGNGWGVISSGNPDTADNVVTYVPGTTSNIRDPSHLLSRMDTMANDATVADPSETTASILWLGYDAPQLLDFAASGSYAEKVSESGDLRAFQEGLRATHEGDASHNTLLGHSYGTTVIGYTAREPQGVNADELVLVASPGVGVDHASDLHGVPAGHVWATTSAFDVIRIIPDERYGASPVDGSFGARQFGSDWNPAHGHTNYWDGNYADNPVRRELAYIITGTR